MATVEQTATVTLTCTTCGTGCTAQLGHLDNLLAAGAWTCATCPTERRP